MTAVLSKKFALSSDLISITNVSVFIFEYLYQGLAIMFTGVNLKTVTICKKTRSTAEPSLYND